MHTVLMVVALTLTTSMSPQEAWPPAGVVPFGPGVTAPVLQSQVQPRYTPDAMRARLQGFVTFEFVVELDGTVGPVRVIRSLDAASGLDDAAMVALKQWRFSPGLKGGAPVRVLATAMMAFTLRDVPPPLTLPRAFAQAQAQTDGWTSAEVPAGTLTVVTRLPPSWRSQPASGPAAAVFGDINGGRSLGVLRAQTTPSALVFPLPLLRVQQFSEDMARRFGPRARVVDAGQSEISGVPWLWMELDLLDEARMWAFTTSIQNQVVQLMCTVTTPRLTMTESLRDQAIAQGAGDCLGVISGTTVRVSGPYPMR